MARGLTNRQIAAALHISERTAENHVQHILTKLGLQNRTQIAVLGRKPRALRLGWHWGGKPRPFGIMTGGTGAGGSSWTGRNISFPCIQA